MATAFSFSPVYFFAARFVTGAGIGGEYSAINSAIDELIPARVRGRVDLMINGSYWVGSAAGAAAALFFLDTSIFAPDLGWRLAFGVGAVLGLTILLVRRNVPESPRWLFIHGREEEAEQIVEDIEQRTEDETGSELETAQETITIRQRERIPFREIARTAFKLYPRRSILGLALFVGQAFLYNGVVFNLGGLFTKYFNVPSDTVPVFVILFALGNFLGPILLGRLFDTVGRKPMIVLTYLGSSAIALAMALLFLGGSLTRWSLEGFIIATFFLASAGASAAYLTVSEVFPMETRALAIAFFYAVGTAVGGITGPLVFSHLIASGSHAQVATAFLIGLALMAVGGLAELLLSVRAEQQSLEDIAQPLTADAAQPEQDEIGAGDESESPPPAASSEVLACRRSALEERARAAEHRAAARELQARSTNGGGEIRWRIDAELTLAETAELRAHAQDERAIVHQELGAAACASSEEAKEAARERAAAAGDRACAFERRAESLSAEREDEARRGADLADAMVERARAHEQRALAHNALLEGQDGDGAAGDAAEARAQVHDAWATVHEERARVHELKADDDDAAARHQAITEEHVQLAQAAEELAYAAAQRQASAELNEEQRRSERAHEASEAAARRRASRAREAQIRARIERRQQHERQGLRRFRPGPGSGSAFFSPGMVGTSGASPESAEALELEVDVIARALDEHGPLERGELARLVGARYWGPGRFRQALRAAIDEDRAQRRSRGTYGPPDSGDGSRP